MSDYSQDVKETYDDIAEDGGAIVLLRPADDATDAARPWRGSATAPAEVPTFGLWDQETTAQGLKTGSEVCYIPAYGLEFEVLAGLFLRDEANTVWRIDVVSPVRPNGVQTILYQCTVSKWPS